MKKLRLYPPLFFFFFKKLPLVSLCQLEEDESSSKYQAKAVNLSLIPRGKRKQIRSLKLGSKQDLLLWVLAALLFKIWGELYCQRNYRLGRKKHAFKSLIQFLESQIYTSSKETVKTSNITEVCAFQ